MSKTKMGPREQQLRDMRAANVAPKVKAKKRAKPVVVKLKSRARGG